MRSKLLRVLSLVASVYICCGFDGCFADSYNPNQGFTVKTEEGIGVLNGIAPPIKHPMPNLPVSGYFQVNDQFTTGSVQEYGANTDLNGLYWVNNAEVEALWYHEVNFKLDCGNAYPQRAPGIYYVDRFLTENKGVLDWSCIHYVTLGTSESSTVKFTDTSALPNSVTFTSTTGINFDSTYGMPQVYVYGETSAASGLQQILTATSISSDATQATFPFPSSLPPGLYGLAIENQGANGVTPVDSNFLSIASRQTFTTPYGVAAQVSKIHSTTTIQEQRPDGTCYPTKHTSSYSSTDNFPIVTEYSSSKLNVTGTEISVGTNPTAVLVYDLRTVTSNDTPDDLNCITVLTTNNEYQRAVVANSGTDTISIVDLGALTVLNTVTVGMNPSSLVMSSDGTTVYVSSATDGTISKVSLATGTVSATANVGSSLTSLDIAPDGSLWAGGTIGLFHVDTSSMQLLGTYPTNGNPILAVKYALTGSELVLTSSASNGSINVAEIDPAATVMNNSMSTLATRQVSHLPTNFQPMIAHGTVQTQNGIPLQLASGALSGVAANDGWLTISATPTGFVVTDTVDHIQMMSGSTPGPVTAIAIDPLEQTAYLAVPDAGVVMSVPVPSNPQ